MKSTFYPGVSTEVVIGRGARHHFLEGLEDIKDKKIILVSTRGMRRRGMLDFLNHSSIQAEILDVQSNPTMADIRKMHQRLNALLPVSHPDQIRDEIFLSIGGGSALDSAKALAAVRAMGEKSEDFYALIQAGKALPDAVKIAPIVALPTTAGTGSEVTPYATLWDEVTGAKYSLFDQRTYPLRAVLDPELTVQLPMDVTVMTALDALSHSMESIWNHGHHNVSDELAKKSISTIVENLPLLIEDLSNLELRQKLQEAALWAGVAIAHTKTALAHSISYPLTSHLGVPHGLACSLTLAEVLRHNFPADPNRLKIIFEALQCEQLEEAVNKIYCFYKDIGVAKLLKGYVGDAHQFQMLTGQLINPSRVKNNLMMTTDQEAFKLLIKSYHQILNH